MTDLRNQRRLAAEVLGIGETRVWIDPLHTEEVAAAVTRADVRGLVEKGHIVKIQAKGVSRGRARALAVQKSKGKRKGPGSRQGSSTSLARDPRKARWMRTIRPLRQTLALLRDEERIDGPTYRRYYRRAKGGVFRSRAHLLSHLVTDGLLTEEQARDVRQRAEELRAQSFGKRPGGAQVPKGVAPGSKQARQAVERRAEKADRRAARKAAKAVKGTRKKEPEAPEAPEGEARREGGGEA